MSSEYINPSERYILSDYLRDEISKEDEQYSLFMEKVDRFFTENSAFNIAIDGIKGASQNAISVLRIISNATLGWHKPYERLNIKELTASRSASNTHITAISERTVYRCLRVLEDNGLIFKFTDGTHAHASFFGINIRAIFDRIDKHYSNFEIVCKKNLSTLNAFNELKDFPVFDTVCDTIEKFSGHVFKSRDELSAYIAETGGLMTTLKSSIERAQKKAQEASEAHTQAKADQPFFFENGEPNPLAALALWQKEITDAEKYGQMKQRVTGQIIGQMKYFLKECKSAGLTEEQIRKRIHDIVNNWDLVPETAKALSAVSRNGKPYTVRMHPTPDFSFFFAYRDTITYLVSTQELLCAPAYSNKVDQKSVNLFYDAMYKEFV